MPFDIFFKRLWRLARRSFVTLMLAGGVIAALVWAAYDFDGMDRLWIPEPSVTQQIQEQLLPHRAVYRFTTASIRNSSSIADVAGGMAFEVAATCDGWEEKQKIRLQFLYTAGEQSETVTDSSNYESNDGRNFRFNIHRFENDKETESVRGSALLEVKKDNGSVNYELPISKSATIPGDSMFPMQHTAMLLYNAMNNKKFFTTTVFDGADAEGLSEISAFIGTRYITQEKPLKILGLESPDLLMRPAWPVRLAFFSPDAKGGEPDYEMDMMMQDDGVIRSLRMDYGDFVVTGTLVAFSPLQRPQCSATQ